MLKAIIIEDEELNSDLLQTLINEFFTDVEVVNISSSVQDAYQTIQKYKEKQLLLFLDIELGNTDNGLDLLNLIDESNHKVIITSAFANYALQTYKYKARPIDFLLKPIRISELIEAVNRAKKLFESEITYSNTELDRGNEILVRTFNRLIPIKTDSIIYIKSEDGKSQIVLKEDKLIHSVERIGEIELKLDKSFYRTHQSFIINLNYLSELINEEGVFKVELLNNHQIPVSRRSQKELKVLIENR